MLILLLLTASFAQSDEEASVLPDEVKNGIIGGGWGMIAREELRTDHRLKCKTFYRLERALDASLLREDAVDPLDADTEVTEDEGMDAVPPRVSMDMSLYASRSRDGDAPYLDLRGTPFRPAVLEWAREVELSKWGAYLEPPEPGDLFTDAFHPDLFAGIGLIAPFHTFPALLELEDEIVLHDLESILGATCR